MSDDYDFTFEFDFINFFTPMKFTIGSWITVMLMVWGKDVFAHACAVELPNVIDYVAFGAQLIGNVYDIFHKN